MNSKYYNKNLKALAEHSPDLAAVIDQSEKESWTMTEPMDNGMLNLYVSDGARTSAVYNKIRPRREAKAVLDFTSLRKEDVTVLVGMGLGYASFHILKSMQRGHQLVIVEPIPYMLKLAFGIHDFSRRIKTRELIIATTRQDAALIVALLEEQRYIEAWYPIMEIYTKVRSEYLEVTAYVLGALNQARCNTGTVAGSGAIIADNDIANLPHVLSHRGVVELKDLFLGKPAVLVSTGPSLERNIHMLRGVQDNVIIIAVGQALRILLAHDIRPDFICTVDFGEINMGHFKGLMNSDVPMVAINRAYAPLLKAYRGPKFISSSATEDSPTAVGLLADRGTLPQGGSVAHMCYGLGWYMGCDPLIFVGQDLALKEKSHCSQADAGGKISLSEDGEIIWNVTDPRCSLHKKETSMGPAVMTPGYYGKPVMTNTGLAAFLTSMEGLVEMCPSKTINATEGGAAIKMAEPMFLRRVIKKHLSIPIDKSILAPLLTRLPDAEIVAFIEKALPRLEGDIEILKEIAETSGEAIRVTETMERLSSDDQRTPTEQAQLESLGKKNDTLARKTHGLAGKMPLVAASIFGAAQKIQSREYQTTGQPLKNNKSLKQGIRRSLFILRAAEGAAISLLKTYTGSAEALELALNVDDPSILQPKGDTEVLNLKDAKQYLAEGNWARPLLIAQKIQINLRDMAIWKSRKVPVCNKEDAEQWKAVQKIIDECTQLRKKGEAQAKELQDEDRESGRDLLPLYFYRIEEAQKFGHKGDFESGLGKLQEAHILQPDREEARWGLATAYHHLKDYHLSMSLYEKLVDKYPENHRYRYEMGQVQIKDLKTQEGLANIQIAMEKTNEFDHFIGVIARLYALHGLTQEAIAAYQIHLEGNPDDLIAREALRGLRDRN